VEKFVKPTTLEFDRGTLLLELGERELPEDLKNEIPIQFDPRRSVWRCDAIYYPRLIEWLRQMDMPVENHVSRWCAVTWKSPALPRLRPEQEEAVAAWLETKKGLVVMPTGTGKTEVALAIMMRLAVSTLVVAPVRDLMYQWHDRIQQRLGYDAGIIGDNVYRVHPVSVITYDSACIHMDKLGRLFGLIIFDECHHLPGRMRREAALMSAAPFRLGLTATPERSDQRHEDLEWLIGPQVFNLPLSKVKGETLADYETVRIPVRLSREEQAVYDECSAQVREYIIRRNREQTGAFNMKDVMAEVAGDPEARKIQTAYYKMLSIQDRAAEKLRVLEDIFRLHVGEQVIVFTGSNIMAREISSRFLIPCLLNHCMKAERKKILDDFRSNLFPAIVANQVLDEGVDIPEAKVGVVVGGSASTRQAKQRLGRILRKAGNRRGVMYEIVCQSTGEERKSRKRRSSDAYEGTRHRKL
jgi:superfamily II DNA or RNA helicase